tara:strand:+ start:202 stop:471 length:270 start_codon:yes stop_codon:yes gene_type:complete
VFNQHSKGLNMTIQIVKIGNIDNGIDGSEEYLLLTNSEDNLTENQAWEYLHPLVYRDTDTAGAYFCHYVKTMQKTDNSVVCIVYHQYNV